MSFLTEELIATRPSKTADGEVQIAELIRWMEYVSTVVRASDPKNQHVASMIDEVKFRIGERITNDQRVREADHVERFIRLADEILENDQHQEREIENRRLNDLETRARVIHQLGEEELALVSLKVQSKMLRKPIVLVPAFCLIIACFFAVTGAAKIYNVSIDINELIGERIAQLTEEIRRTAAVERQAIRTMGEDAKLVIEEETKTQLNVLTSESVAVVLNEKLDLLVSGHAPDVKSAIDERIAAFNSQFSASRLNEIVSDVKQASDQVTEIKERITQLEAGIESIQFSLDEIREKDPNQFSLAFNLAQRASWFFPIAVVVIAIAILLSTLLITAALRANSARRD